MLLRRRLDLGRHLCRRLLHGVRIDLQTDWGNWLQGLPGRGPGIEYQIQLDT